MATKKKTEAKYGWATVPAKRPKRKNSSEEKILSTYSLTLTERKLLENICSYYGTSQSEIIRDAILHLASKRGLLSHVSELF